MTLACKHRGVGTTAVPLSDELSLMCVPACGVLQKHTAGEISIECINIFLKKYISMHEKRSGKPRNQYLKSDPVPDQCIFISAGLVLTDVKRFVFTKVPHKKHLVMSKSKAKSSLKTFTTLCCKTVLVPAPECTVGDKCPEMKRT